MTGSLRMNNGICALSFRFGVLLALLIVLASASAWSTTIGPDTFGYLATNNTSYSFVDISATGAAILAGADDDRALLEIGFPFIFYGNSYSSACISSNGLISFGGCNPSDFANQNLTNTIPAGNYPTIAPLWLDLTFAARGAGAVHYQTFGQQGSRRFVIQWHKAYVINGTKGITFQVILHEGNGKIVFQYLDIDTGANAAGLGGSATVGIRDSSSQSNGHSLQWSFKAPVLHNAEAISFVPDSEPPVISGMPGSGCTLWPPNHKLVTVATVSAGDSGSGLATFTVTGVSNEPEGDPPDIVITGSGNQYTVQLRAERDGSGEGRIYTITATAIDNAGNDTPATATCTVPHDRGK
jgi:hypothetical protein